MCAHSKRGMGMGLGLGLGLGYFPQTPSTAANKHFTFEYAPLLVRRSILLYFARTRICAYLLYISTNTGVEEEQHSHAHTSIFYHNFDAARLINLFAENIFTSFIRKNRRPTHHHQPPMTMPMGKCIFHQLLTIFSFCFSFPWQIPLPLRRKPFAYEIAADCFPSWSIIWARQRTVGLLCVNCLKIET